MPERLPQPHPDQGGVQLLGQGGHQGIHLGSSVTYPKSSTFESMWASWFAGRRAMTKD